MQVISDFCGVFTSLLVSETKPSRLFMNNLG